MTTCSDASELNPLDPIDRLKVSSDVRFLMGDISTEALSETTLTIVLESCILKFEDSAIYTSDVTYCTLLDSLKYLIRQSWTDVGGDVRGALKRSKEKEGNVAYEDEYESSGQAVSSGWEKMYNYFLENPAEVSPCLEVSRGNTFGLINIGGTNQDTYIAIENNTNNKSFWGSSGIGTKFSSKREARRRQSNARSKYIY